MAEILKHGTIKIHGIIDGYLLRDSITTDDVLPKKILDGGGGYIGYWLCFNPFGKVLNCDNGEGVVSWAGVSLPMISMPHCYRGHDGAINCEGCTGALQRWEIFDKLHMLLQIWLCHQSLLASRILAGGP
jgi:hypothetical protein